MPERQKLARARARVLLAASLSCAAAVAACSLDLSGYHVDDASDPDGALGDGGVGSEGSTSGDGNTATESGGADGGGSQVPFCQGSTHTFCADFDEGALQDHWSRSETDPAGSLELSTNRAKDGPRSLFASLTRRAMGDPSRRNQLEKGFGGPWRHTIIELDMYIEPLDWMSGDINSAVISTEFFSNGSGDGFFFALGPTYGNLNDSSGPPPATGTWIHAKIDIDYPAGMFTGNIGGRSYSHGFTTKTAGSNPSMVVSIGINGFNAPAPTFSIYYDNVTIDVL